MSRLQRKWKVLLPVLLVALSACTTVPRKAPAGAEVVAQASPQAIQQEQQRQLWLAQHPDWSFQGRAAISRGRDGGSGRVEWQQHGGDFSVRLSAPVTRQGWQLSVNAEGARLEGLEGGPRQGADAEQLLQQAAGWAIPVNQLGDWVRGQIRGAERIQRDAKARPRQLQRDGWTIEFLEWSEPQQDRPALPRRIDAVNGDAKVRLLLDQWEFNPE